MTLALPKLTPEEKRQALRKAQQMRMERAKVRQQLKKRQVTLRQVLEKANGEVVGKMRVAYLLQSLPQVGKVTSRKIMDDIGIHETRRVQGLGKRQREQLLARLS